MGDDMIWVKSVPHYVNMVIGAVFFAVAWPFLVLVGVFSMLRWIEWRVQQFLEE